MELVSLCGGARFPLYMYRVCIQDVSSIIHARYIHDTYPDVNTTAIHARYVRYIALRTPKFGIHCDTFGYIWIHPWIQMYRPRNSLPARSDRLRIDYFAFFATCLRSSATSAPAVGSMNFMILPSALDFYPPTSVLVGTKQAAGCGCAAARAAGEEE